MRPASEAPVAVLPGRPLLESGALRGAGDRVTMSGSGQRSPQTRRFNREAPHHRWSCGCRGLQGDGGLRWSQPLR